MSFDLFPWIRDRMQRLRDQANGDEKAVRAGIRRLLNGLAAQRGGGKMDFDRGGVRFAYITKLGPLTVDVMRSAFVDLGRGNTLPPGFSLFSRQGLQVVSLGGGPGTDALGFLNSLAGPAGGGVTLTVVDKEAAWARSMHDLMTEFVRQRPEFGDDMLRWEHHSIDLDSDEGIAELRELDFFSHVDLGERAGRVYSSSRPRVLLCSRLISALEAPNSLVDFIVNETPPGTLVCVVAVERHKADIAAILKGLGDRTGGDLVVYDTVDRLPWSRGASFTVPADLRWLLDAEVAGDSMALQIDQVGFLAYIP